MKAVLTKPGGGSAALYIGEIPKPVPNEDQLLIQVRAAALNNADLLQRDGKWSAPPGELDILGVEVAGDVVVPDRAGNFLVGTPVFGLLGGGGYATYAAMDVGLATIVPSGLSYAEAAALPEAMFIGDTTLFELGALEKEDWVLIHGGGGGMGSMAIQMARAAGAHVACTVGSNNKAQKALCLGAELAVNYTTTDFADAIMHWTEGEGINLVIDIIGADYLAHNIAILKERGRLIQLGVMAGSIATLDLDQVLLKRLQIKGTIMRPLPIHEKRQIVKRFRDHWLDAVTSRQISAVIDSLFPLEQVAMAHDRLAASEHFGKIILDVDRALSVPQVSYEGGGLS